MHKAVPYAPRSPLRYGSCHSTRPEATRRKGGLQIYHGGDGTILLVISREVWKNLVDCILSYLDGCLNLLIGSLSMELTNAKTQSH